ALGAGLTVGAQRVLLVADFTNGRLAVDQHPAHLTGAQPQRCVVPLTGNQLHRSARRARQLRALARLHLNAVDLRAERDIPQRQRITSLDRRIGAGNDLGSGLDPAGRDNIAPLAVRIKYQGDIRGPVRVVLDALDAGRHAVLVALEVDDPVAALVATALMAGGNAPGVVTPAVARVLFQQRRVRLALPERRVLHLDDEAPARGCRFCVEQCHEYSPVSASIWRQSAAPSRSIS